MALDVCKSKRAETDAKEQNNTLVGIKERPAKKPVPIPRTTLATVLYSNAAVVKN